MATKEHSTPEGGVLPRRRYALTVMVSKLQKTSSCLLLDASYICDCQSYRVKPAVVQRFENRSRKYYPNNGMIPV